MHALGPYKLHCNAVGILDEILLGMSGMKDIQR